MYLEDLAFCIKRAGWKVTKTYSHLTFEQARFKRKFILMNQKSRQKFKKKMILKKTFTNLSAIQILVTIAEITLIIGSLFLYLMN